MAWAVGRSSIVMTAPSMTLNRMTVIYDLPEAAAMDASLRAARVDRAKL